MLAEVRCEEELIGMMGGLMFDDLTSNGDTLDFEFNNFYVTGFHKVSHENGPNPDDFDGPKYIFSGHFHQRQIGNNIIYIGNTFPFDFSDKNDDKKGICIYDHDEEKYEFIDWIECPKFVELKLSTLLSRLQKEKNIFEDKTSVNCLMDIPLTYEEHITVKKLILDSYKLREFRLKELPDTSKAITESDDILIDFTDMEDLPILNDLVILMLDKIESDNIDNMLLKKLYTQITI